MLARLTSNASRKPTVKPVEEYKPVPIEKPDEDKENLDKPLPIPIERKRPGTSGTELVLRADRVEASTAFQRAQKAEQEYRARRQATIARSDAKAAKVHLGEASKQFRAGVRAGMGAVRLMPSVVREKQSAWREKREKKRLAAEKIKKEKEAKEKARKEKEEKEEKEEAERKKTEQDAEDKDNVAPEDEEIA